MGNYFKPPAANNDECIFKSPQMDVRSQMRCIIEYWIRLNVSVNLRGTITSIDIINLIIDTFTYQSIFEEEHNDKLINREWYIQKIKKAQQSKIPSKKSSTPCEYDFLFKLLLIGDSSVGKTSLLDRYTNVSDSGSFQTKTIEINDKTIKLQIWDTAGQESRSYYRGAHGVIMVYDIGNKLTFDNLNKYYGEIEKYASTKACRILVGNKTDLKEKYLNSGEVVSNEDAQTLANNWKIAGCIQTSALNGDNVTKAFESIATEIYNRVEGRVLNPFCG